MPEDACPLFFCGNTRTARRNCDSLGALYMELGRPDRSNVFKRIAEVLEQGGVEHLLVRGFGKLTSPAFSIGSLIFFRRDLRESTPQPQPIPGITLRFASVQDAPLLGGNDPVVTRTLAHR